MNTPRFSKLAPAALAVAFAFSAGAQTGSDPTTRPSTQSAPTAQQPSTPTPPGGSQSSTPTGSQGQSAGQSGMQSGGSAGGNRTEGDTGKVAKAQGAGTLNSNDKTFITKAAASDLAEIEAAKVALQKAQSPEVKKFAQQMLDDHTKSSGELKKLAAAKGVALPDQPDSNHRRKLDEMQKLSGAEFDKRYLQEAGSKDHKAAMNLYENASKNARDPEVKAFAEKTLPVIQGHHQMVQQMTSGKAGGSTAKAGGDAMTKSQGTPATQK